MFYLRGRHALCMVANMGSKNNLNFCQCHFKMLMSSYFQMYMPHIMFDGSCQYFQERNTALCKCFGWSLLNDLICFPVHGIPNALFFKCYLISETTAAVKWLQIRYNVVFRLLGVLYLWECNGEAFTSSNKIRKENIWEHADLQVFFSYWKTNNWRYSMFIL